jgi:hypothetical protein
MILPTHPDNPTEAKGLRAIGYWRGTWNETLPDPKNYVDLSWDPTERQLVAAYLAAAADVVHWRGWSTCRLCGVNNGSTCKADGVFVWPEGLAHYVTAHSVRPPQEFVDHVKRALIRGSGT